MVNWRVKPMRSASRRSRRAESAWKVPIQRPDGARPRRRDTRSRISPAALLVKVTAKIRSGGTPSASISRAMRAVRTRVFPDPAPARTRSGPWTCSTASRCAGLSGVAVRWNDSGFMERQFDQERCTGVGRLEGQIAAVRVLDDALGQREADAPPTLLGGDTGLEEAAADVAVHPGPVVSDPHHRPTTLGTHLDADGALPSLQRVDGVLHQRLEGPLEQHGIAEDHGAGAP